MQQMSEMSLYYTARAAGWDPTPFETPPDASTLSDGWMESASAFVWPTEAPADFASVLDGRASWAIAEGDAIAQILRLPDDSVDALITDGPYSSGGQYRADREGGNRKYLGPESAAEFPRIDGDNRDQRSFLVWCTMWLDQARRKTKEGGFAVLFTDWRQLPATTDALQAGGWVWRGVLPWIKPGARPQLGRFTQSAEFIVWGTKGPATTEGACHAGHFEEMAPRAREAPTEKPETLMRQLVRVVPEGGVILDPFAGSATTLVAALAEGYRAIGVESSRHYAGKGRRRCLAATSLRDRWQPDAQGALFGGPTP